jgi:hypothetical protein
MSSEVRFSMLCTPLPGPLLNLYNKDADVALMFEEMGLGY